MRKRRRQDPPEFVSLATLAHRLEIGERRAESYVKSGYLPRPHQIGTLDRWYWPDVVEYLAGQEGQEPEANGDDYSAQIAKIRKKARAAAS